MRSNLVVIAGEQSRLPHVSTGCVRFIDVPAVDVTYKEIRIGNPGDTAVEFKISGADIAPIRIILVSFIVLTTNFDGVLTTNHSEDVGSVVNTLAQRGIDVAVFAASGAFGDAARTGAAIDSDFRKYVCWGICAVSRFKAD